MQPPNFGAPAGITPWLQGPTPSGTFGLSWRTLPGLITGFTPAWAIPAKKPFPTSPPSTRSPTAWDSISRPTCYWPNADQQGKAKNCTRRRRRTGSTWCKPPTIPRPIPDLRAVALQVFGRRAAKKLLASYRHGNNDDGKTLHSFAENSSGRRAAA